MKKLFISLVAVLMLINCASAAQTPQKKKFNEVRYVNCQVHYAYENNKKKSDFTFQHVKAQKYYGILSWMKKKGIITDFEIGNTLKDATKITIKGYNPEKEMYKCYSKKSK